MTTDVVDVKAALTASLTELHAGRRIFDGHTDPEKVATYARRKGRRVRTVKTLVAYVWIIPDHQNESSLSTPPLKNRLQR